MLFGKTHSLLIYLVIAFVVTISSGCNEKEKLGVSGNNIMGETSTTGDGMQLPTIKAKLGAGVHEIKYHSTFQFNDFETDGVGVYFVDKPHKFIYADPNIGFEINAARYLMLATEMGYVTHIEIGPQVEYLTVNNAFDEAESLVNMLERVGWIRDKSVNFKSLSELKQKFDVEGAKPGKAGIGIWRKGDNKITLYFSLARKPGEPYSDKLGYKESKYLLLIHIDNPAIMKKWGGRSLETLIEKYRKSSD